MSLPTPIDYEAKLFSHNKRPAQLSEKQIKRLLETVQLPSLEKTQNSIQSASLWKYTRGDWKRVLTVEEKRSYNKLRKKAQALLQEMEKFKTGNEAIHYFEDKPFQQSPSFLQGHDSVKKIVKKCKQVVLNTTDNFPEFVFEAALLYEFLTHELFVSIQETDDLTTRGERFIETACKIVSELRYKKALAKYNDNFNSYQENSPNDNAPVQEQKTPQSIKIACENVSDRLALLRDKK